MTVRTDYGDCPDRWPVTVDQAIVQYIVQHTPNKWTDTFCYLQQQRHEAQRGDEPDAVPGRLRRDRGGGRRGGAGREAGVGDVDLSQAKGFREDGAENRRVPSTGVRVWRERHLRPSREPHGRRCAEVPAVVQALDWGDTAFVVRAEPEWRHMETHDRWETRRDAETRVHRSRGRGADPRTQNRGPDKRANRRVSISHLPHSDTVCPYDTDISFLQSQVPRFVRLGPERSVRHAQAAVPQTETGRVARGPGETHEADEIHARELEYL